MIKPEKSYTNLEFLHSPEARNIRVLCELTEPKNRLFKQKVHSTIVFFGSARTLSPEEAEKKISSWDLSPADAPPSIAERERQTRVLRRMAQYYQDAVDLADKLTRWSMKIQDATKRFYICSGGGPGMMEAACRGASQAGGKSLGLNISLPFEQIPNCYQTPELAFEFHYFFVRKFWFFYLAKALVIFPGGFGTLDELSDLLTLVQTKKTHKYMPIIIYGTEYWNQVLDFAAMVDWGTLGPEDLKLFHYFDDVDAAFDFLTRELSTHYL